MQLFPYYRNFAQFGIVKSRVQGPAGSRGIETTSNPHFRTDLTAFFIVVHGCMAAEAQDVYQKVDAATLAAPLRHSASKGSILSKPRCGKGCAMLFVHSVLRTFRACKAQAPVVVSDAIGGDIDGAPNSNKRPGLHFVCKSFLSLQELTGNDPQIVVRKTASSLGSHLGKTLVYQSSALPGEVEGLRD